MKEKEEFKELEEELREALGQYKDLEEIELSEMAVNILPKLFAEQIFNKFNAAQLQLKERLRTYFEYEKQYLELIKEYKEEIKFVNSIQEDLRKERAKFFSDTLSEVSASLKEADVDKATANKWIFDLVDSYTKSMNISQRLVEENTCDTIGEIRSRAKDELGKSKKE